MGGRTSHEVRRLLGGRRALLSEIAHGGHNGQLCQHKCQMGMTCVVLHALARWSYNSKVHERCKWNLHGFLPKTSLGRKRECG